MQRLAAAGQLQVVRVRDDGLQRVAVAANIDIEGLRSLLMPDPAYVDIVDCIECSFIGSHALKQKQKQKLQTFTIYRSSSPFKLTLKIARVKS